MRALIFSLLISSAHATFAGEPAFRNQGNSRDVRLQQAHLDVESVFGKKSCSSHACQSASFEEREILNLHEESLKKIESLQQDKSFQDFQKQALEAGEKVLESSSFQEMVSDLKTASHNPLETDSHSSQSELYIFVSFSLGEPGLLNLAHEAKTYGATLVLRGFRERSYIKTVKSLEKIIRKTGQGVIIDPELFSLFSIQSVPTIVLAKPFQLRAETRIQTPIHDRIQGHLTMRYALETFAKDGDLKRDAKTLLAKGEPK